MRKWAAAPQKNQYSFKMLGFEKQLNRSGKRHFATYTDLPGGEYIFRIKASNNDGIWNKEGVSLRIKILPPFWQTWLFRGVVLATVLLLVFFIFRIRTRSIRQRAKLLERRVEERTLKLRDANQELQKEISVRKRTEEELHVSLKEKEILLKEIHHRVKNNMQIISSLLSLQSRSIRDAKILEIFKNTRDRIRMMALIHENLYRSKDLGCIDFAEYIRQLVDQLFCLTGLTRRPSA